MYPIWNCIYEKCQRNVLALGLFKLSLCYNLCAVYSFSSDCNCNWYQRLFEYMWISNLTHNRFLSAVPNTDCHRRSFIPFDSCIETHYLENVWSKFSHKIYATLKTIKFPFNRILPCLLVCVCGCARVASNSNKHLK